MAYIKRQKPDDVNLQNANRFITSSDVFRLLQSIEDRSGTLLSGSYVSLDTIDETDDDGKANVTVHSFESDGSSYEISVKIQISDIEKYFEPEPDVSQKHRGIQNLSNESRVLPRRLCMIGLLVLLISNIVFLCVRTTTVTYDVMFIFIILYAMSIITSVLFSIAGWSIEYGQKQLIRRKKREFDRIIKENDDVIFEKTGLSTDRNE